MSLQLVVANAVIAATQWNPSVFGEAWLKRNDILAEDGLLAGSLFSDLAAQIQSPAFTLVVLPQQLQFAPRSKAPEEARAALAKLSRLVELVQHTPFVALGVNFLWHADFDAQPNEFTRRLFAGANPIYREFDSPDARFGAYLSKDAGSGFRLKLDAKPIRAGADRERVQLVFNYQLELRDPAKKAAEIQRGLERWDEFRDGSYRLAKLMAGVE